MADKDAFSLSEEDFEILRAGAGTQDAGTQDAGTQDAGTQDAGTQDAGTQDAGTQDAGTQDTEEFDIDSFLTSGFGADDGEGTTTESTETADSGKPAATAAKPEMIKIVHKGQLVEVTSEEALLLAQKGYNYEAKMARIAPHRKLIDLIEADSELQEKINRHVFSKTAPKVSKREDFASEEEWLQDNMERNAAANNPIIGNAPAPSTEDTTGQNKEPGIVTALRAHDPQNYERIMPVMKQIIPKLSVADYAAMNTPDKILKFYDAVKVQVLKNPGTSTPNLNTGNSKSKTFNLRSGTNKSAGKPAPVPKNAWDLSNKDFNSVIKKVKGF